jgi:hypothetical protein
VVIIDEPKGSEWGGYNAGPIFRNIANHALAYLGVPPDAAPDRVARGVEKAPDKI